MGTWCDDFLRRHGAPGLHTFTSADVVDLRAEFPQAAFWMANRFLNHAAAEMWGKRLEDRWHRYGLGIVSRASALFRSYHAARDATLEYLAKSPPKNPALERYFSAASLWEACLLHFWSFANLYNAVVDEVKRADPAYTGKPLFEMQRAGGRQRRREHRSPTKEESAYEIANAVKHWGRQILGDHAGDPSCTLPLWLTNDGIHSVEYTVPYADMAQLTREVANYAEDYVSFPGHSLQAQNGVLKLLG